MTMALGLDSWFMRRGGDEKLKERPVQDRIGASHFRAGCHGVCSRLPSSSYSSNLGVCGLSSYLGLEAALHASIMGPEAGFEVVGVALQAHWSVAFPHRLSLMWTAFQLAQVGSLCPSKFPPQIRPTGLQ